MRTLTTRLLLASLCLTTFLLGATAAPRQDAAPTQDAHSVRDDPRWLTFPGKGGPGAGRHYTIQLRPQ